MANPAVEYEKQLRQWLEAEAEVDQPGVKGPRATPDRLPQSIELAEWEKIQKAVDAYDVDPKTGIRGLKGKELRAMFALAYGAGLRVGELVKFRVSEIRSGPRGTAVLTFMGKGPGGMAAGKGKEASIFLDPTSFDAVKDWLNSRPPQLTPNGTIIDDPYLFPSRRGNKAKNHVSPDWFRKQFDNIARAAGFNDTWVKKNASPHNIRHSFVQHLIDSGVDPLVVQGMARHADFKTTAIYYNHRPRAALQAVIQYHPANAVKQIVAAEPLTDPLTAVKMFSSDAVAFKVQSAYQRFVVEKEINSTQFEAAINAIDDLGNDAKKAIIADATAANIEDVRQVKRISFGAQQAGALPGTEVIPAPGQDLKSKQGISAPKGKRIRSDLVGMALVAKNMMDENLTVDKAYARLGESAAMFKLDLEGQIAAGSNSAREALDIFEAKVRNAFPDGIYHRGVLVFDVLDAKGKVLLTAGSISPIDEIEAIAHAMKKQGILVPFDDANMSAARAYWTTELEGKPSGTAARIDVREAIDRGGSDPFTHVEFDKKNNTKILNRNQLAGAEQRMPLYKLAGYEGGSGFRLHPALVDSGELNKIEVKETKKLLQTITQLNRPVWATRTPTEAHLGYFNKELDFIKADAASKKKNVGNTEASKNKHLKKTTNAAFIAGGANAELRLTQPPVQDPRVLAHAAAQTMNQDTYTIISAVALAGEVDSPEESAEPKKIETTEPSKQVEPPKKGKAVKVPSLADMKKAAKIIGSGSKVLGPIITPVTGFLGFGVALEAGDVMAKTHGVAEDPEEFSLEKSGMVTGAAFDIKHKNATGLPVQILMNMLETGRTDLIEKARKNWAERKSMRPEERERREKIRATYAKSRITTLSVEEQEKYILKTLYQSGQEPGYRLPGFGYTGVPIEQRRSSNQPSFLEMDQ